MVKLIKAEILITRRCNLRCSYCDMVKEREEITLEQWKKGIDAMYNLGIRFAPIYGAEPTLVMDKLCGFVKYAESKGINTSVITNCIDLTNEKLDRLYDNGLRSLTFSFDGWENFADSSTEAKSKAWVKPVEYFQSLPNIRDVEACMTIGRHNFKQLPKMIEYCHERGFWANFDIVHPAVGNPGEKVKGDCKELLFTLDDMSAWGKVLDKVIEMKKSGYKLNTSIELLEMLKDPRYCIAFGWKCSKLAFITVDCNGDVYGCDSFQPHSMAGKYKVWNIDKEFENFRRDWMNELKYCKSCIWGTHFLSEQFVDHPEGDKFFQHRTNLK